MTLYELTLQIVPLIFISLFLDVPRDTQESTGRTRQEGRIETVFEIAVAALGLIAFIISLYVIGDDRPEEPAAWMRPVVITALSFSMAALSTQVFLRIGKKRSHYRD